ncbi:acyl-CoA thioesterase [Vulgatibacter sp.]|uniref:acyl-CoA thioesterase n=1 Tax=Vulgatibacter sp. TaxID=1971226 RepID=UPI00356A1374
MRFYETTHGVYFDDLDAFQILHNARYVLLIERTIGSFWKQLGQRGGLLDFAANPDMSHLVRANHIQYDRPVTGVGEVRVRIWVEKLGSTSLTFGFRVLPLDEDVDYATGSRVLVRIDPETRKPVPWTDALREKLAPYRRDLKREG